MNHRASIIPGVCSAVLFAACAGHDGAPDGAEGVGDVSDAALICPPPPSTTQPQDPCSGHITRTPDAVLVMGPNDTEDHVEVDAPIAPPFGGFPPAPSCPAKVVEVHVPSNSSPVPADCGRAGCYDTVQIAGGSGSFAGATTDEDFDYFRIPNNATACDSYSLWVRLYRKAAGQSSFGFVKKYSYHGVWKGSFCSIETACDPCQDSCLKSYFPNTLTAPLPPASGTDVYRIITSSKAHGDYLDARVKAMYRPLEN